MPPLQLTTPKRALFYRNLKFFTATFFFHGNQRALFPFFFTCRKIGFTGVNQKNIRFFFSILADKKSELFQRHRFRFYVEFWKVFTGKFRFSRPLFGEFSDFFKATFFLTATFLFISRVCFFNEKKNTAPNYW